MTFFISRHCTCHVGHHCCQNTDTWWPYWHFGIVSTSMSSSWHPSNRTSSYKEGSLNHNSAVKSYLLLVFLDFDHFDDNRYILWALPTFLIIIPRTILPLSMQSWPVVNHSLRMWPWVSEWCTWQWWYCLRWHWGSCEARPHNHWSSHWHQCREITERDMFTLITGIQGGIHHWESCRATSKHLH